MLVLGAQEELEGPLQHVARRNHPPRWLESRKTALGVAWNAPHTQLLFFEDLNESDVSYHILLILVLKVQKCTVRKRWCFT